MLTLTVPTLHPDAFLSIKIKAQLLAPPYSDIEFQYSQIDWSSYGCEPNGILIHGHYPPSHTSIYGNAALIKYDSMEIKVEHRGKQDDTSRHSR